MRYTGPTQEHALPDEADQLATALRAFLDEQFRRSPALHAVARELALWVLSRDQSGTDESPQTNARATPPPEIISVGSEPEVRESPDPEPETPDATRPDRSRETESVPLAIGGATIHVEVSGSSAELEAARIAASSPADPPTPETVRADQIDLALVKRRATLKAASCRLYSKLRAVRHDHERERECLAQMQELIDQAHALPDCFLWVFWKQASQPDDAQLEIIAICYETLAAAADLCRQADDPRAGLSEAQIQHAFCMFAEASSALRVALLRTWIVKPDQDQDESHIWLRDQTFTRQVYVPSFMTLSDPADPSRAPELLNEIAALAETIASRKAQLEEISKIINRIKYHAGRLPDDDPGDEHDCRRINEGIDQLLAAGISPRDQRLRAVLATVGVHSFPPAVIPHSFFLDRDAPEAPESPTQNRAWSESVAGVRRFLQGGEIVVVGGERRNDHIARMKDAFGLAEVHWVALTEHASGAPLKAPISRPATRMVVVLIKLAGHQHVDEAKTFARQASKPFVTITAGYNPEQIAEATLAQAADQFAATLNA